MTNSKRMLRWSVVPVLCLMLSAGTAIGQSKAELKSRIAELEAELAKTKEQLAAQEQVARQAQADAEAPEAPRRVSPGDVIPELEGLTIGGAMRVNYVFGDYTASNGNGGPTRGSHGGNFSMDTFRLNADYTRGPWIGKAEYRWYNGYNFFHTLWGGYNFDNDDQLQIGLNRVPFGPGPYGVSQSWFFDQHYYVGLSDDMDYGAKYVMERGKWKFDIAGYVAAEPNWRGGSTDGARYSYDIVSTGTGATNNYRERGQANVRAIYSFDEIEYPTDLGVSLQYGRLQSDANDDAYAYAGSIHSVTTKGPWKLALQLTRYNYDTAANSVMGGFYDYTTLIAKKGTIPAGSLSYTWKPEVDWIDSVTFYEEFSTILKDESGWNDSSMNVLGAAIARGGWYIYVDWAYSQGNQFVGSPFQADDYTANTNTDWKSRFNINFGYYF